MVAVSSTPEPSWKEASKFLPPSTLKEIVTVSEPAKLVAEIVHGTIDLIMSYGAWTVIASMVGNIMVCEDRGIFLLLFYALYSVTVIELAKIPPSFLVVAPPLNVMVPLTPPTLTLKVVKLVVPAVIV